MSILIMSDPHWTDNPRDLYRHDYVKHFLQLIKKHSVECVCILGDLTEKKDNHGAWLVTQVFGHVSAMADLCKVYILRGNHDYAIQSIPFFGSLGKLKNVEWINDPSEVTDMPSPCDMPVLFLPHTRDHEKDWRDIDIRSYKYIFTHNTFAGAKAETGYKLEGISRKVFSKGQVVISGDIHTPQTTGSVTYVGAPNPVDFGDEYPARSLLLRPDVNRMVSGNMISCPYDGPAKRVIDIESKEDLKRVRGLKPNDMLKVYIHLGDKGNARFNELRELVIAWADKHDYRIIMIQPLFDQQRALVGADAKDVRRKSDKDLLLSYATITGIDKLTIKTGLRLMGKI